MGGRGGADVAHWEFKGGWLLENAGGKVKWRGEIDWWSEAGWGMEAETC